jgi:hypothetical protein
MDAPFPELCFATPRKLPKANTLKGRVVVVDVAFASEASGSGFEQITLPLIRSLGPRLAAWVDHHDHVRHNDYREDTRFLLRTKQEHGACPEMITPEVVSRAGAIDTIVCHIDFDGLASAAKWIRGGTEPYAGCDADARAIDTRVGTPSDTAVRMDRAIRACNSNPGILGVIVRHLAQGLREAPLWEIIDNEAQKLVEVERITREYAKGYEVLSLREPWVPSEGKALKTIAVLDLRGQDGSGRRRYDKTMLLLAGQERADMAALLDRDTLTLAAPFGSGANFLALCNLSGGMPTLVSVRASDWERVRADLKVDQR